MRYWNYEMYACLFSSKEGDRLIMEYLKIHQKNNPDGSAENLADSMSDNMYHEWLLSVPNSQEWPSDPPDWDMIWKMDFASEKSRIQMKSL